MHHCRDVCRPWGGRCAFHLDQVDVLRLRGLPGCHAHRALPHHAGQVQDVQVAQRTPGRILSSKDVQLVAHQAGAVATARGRASARGLHHLPRIAAGVVNAHGQRGVGVLALDMPAQNDQLVAPHIHGVARQGHHRGLHRQHRSCLHLRLCGCTVCIAVCREGRGRGGVGLGQACRRHRHQLLPSHTQCVKGPQVVQVAPSVVATNNEHLGAHKTPAVLVAWAGLALFPHRQGCPHICLGVCMCRDERCTCSLVMWLSFLCQQ
mmetsp:Transcript_18881/g.52882  ORF Transcript_18881/g.52882 Transcript_18881/m.52882 type:complete len:263 (+) Transcript_18881:1843-2631(+)